MSKKVNLQPWLDYFEMLHTYEQSGYLLIKPEKHKAYVTADALHTLSGEGDTQPVTTADSISRVRAYAAVMRRLRTYAGWQSHEGKDYMKRPFAVHLVKDEEPHDLLCTILFERRRRWFWPFRKLEHVEVIDYEENGV